MIKIYYIIILLLFLSCPCFSLSQETPPDKIWIVGVGDIMLGTDFPSPNYLPPNSDCSPLLAKVAPILSNADVTFGNLEGTLLNKGKTTKQCSKCYAFKMPEKFVKCLIHSGFDVMSVANNHIGDFGKAGIRSTMSILDANGIHYAGLVQKPYTVFEKNGLRYGFCAFAPNNATAKLNDLKRARQIVKKLAAQSDIVIVSFHGGAEGTKHQHVTRKSERFYGENRGNVYKFAHTVIDAGADVVFGHGPHVTRAMEIYKDRFIIYSLGNFCTYGRFNLKGPKGIAPIVKIAVNKHGAFLGGKVYATRQKYPGIVYLDPNNTVINTLNQLIQADFPKQKLSISSQGNIQYSH